MIQNFISIKDGRWMILSKFWNAHKAKVKRPFFVIILTILLIGSVLLGLSDKDISVADTNIPDNEVTSSVSSNSSATATITITMYTVAGE